MVLFSRLRVDRIHCTVYLESDRLPFIPLFLSEELAFIVFCETRRIYCIGIRVIFFAYLRTAVLSLHAFR